MVRVGSVLVAAALLLTAAPAGAHTLHKADPRNKPRLPLDIKRVGVGHEPGRIFVTIATHGKWKRSILVRRLQDATRRPVRGKSALTVTWRVAGGKVRMALPTFSKGKLLLRIYRGQGRRWVYMGTGKALRHGGRTIVLGIPGNRVGRLPKKTFEYWLESRHLPKPSGFAVEDHAPSAGSYKHKIPRL